jgi:CRP/FNR family transcriptional regulator, cyclic AMP receptor protein
VARTSKGASFDPGLALAALSCLRTITGYRPEQVIFAQGDPADAVFYIVRGRVKMTVTSKRGKEAVIALLGEGDFFGEGCLIGQPARLATAASMTEATVMRVEKAQMTRSLHAEPAFAEAFTAHLLARNSRIEADLVDHLFNPSEKRLARTLLLLANFGGEGGPKPVSLKISQEMLAEMVGTTRSRVSFFMNRFRERGFIEYKGELKVHGSLLSVVLRD